MNKQHLEVNFTHNQLDKLQAIYALSEQQKYQLGRYMELLIEWNKKFNLTAITDPDAIIQQHFNDSLAVTAHVDFKTVHATADIGTGAGFPGVPLHILFPHLTTVLIEVNNKKRSFLAHVAQELELQNIIIYPHDWRTFLRSTNYTIDYFFARASLQPEELIRIFKPSSPYKNATLIYWASDQWVAEKRELPYIEKEVPYRLDTVQRKYVFFKQHH